MKIKADAILGGLYSNDVITLDEKQIIEAKQTNKQQMGYLIDTIMIQSLDIGIVKYKKFLEVLEKNDDIDIKAVAQQLGMIKLSHKSVYIADV